MKSEYYKEVYDILSDHPEEREKHPKLTKVIELIIHAIELQDESNEVNKKLSELNKENK